MIRAGQSRTMSWIESVSDTASSLALGVAINLVIIPTYYGIVMTFWESVGYTSIFALASMVRRYFWRRMFNWLHMKGW